MSHSFEGVVVSSFTHPCVICMTFLLLWNTKDVVLKNVLYAHIIKVCGVSGCDIA